jgi:hypothetical protein
MSSNLSLHNNDINTIEFSIKTTDIHLNPFEKHIENI